MKKIVTGILAHVDAGKTTLSEALLYSSGSIRKMGRVDHKDAFLDTYALERERGITIFSKQAEITLEDTRITLLDTPGHVDFSAEMERCLQILDYAVLVISGTDGVQGHTRTLWQLLEKYQIPTFIFINKMDQSGTDREKLLTGLKQNLNENCIDFGNIGEAFDEEIAMCDEQLLNQFLEEGTITREDIGRLTAARKVFPCYFGSALKLEGVDALMQGLEQYTGTPVYPAEFGAKVFKIARDDQGNRLTYMKITGGELKVRTMLIELDEKVNQIRIYSGEKYDPVEAVEAGTVCAVTGLTKTCPGQGLGIEQASDKPVLEPVLTYQIMLPPGQDAAVMLSKLRQLEEEEPELRIVWDEHLKEIQAQIMGEVQIEILKNLISERFLVEVEFGTGNIVYKETITDCVEGVGHFEPLRHYAEVHVILEPGEPGSGLQFAAQCSEDMLDRNWQRLVLAHLQEKEHKGVLTGSAVTDMRITLAAGRAHQKHTEGGDFRQAAYRAVRQGLKEAKSMLLEPYYEFRLEIPEKSVGRAISDIERMHGTFAGPELEAETAVLTGSAPVICMQYYHQEVISYTKGLGRLFCSLKGYAPCHNADAVIAEMNYDSERDTENPTGSVFCAHGAGFNVPWNEVKEHMHVESRMMEQGPKQQAETAANASTDMEEWIDTDEVDAIINRTYSANKRERFIPRKGINKGNYQKRNEYKAAPVTRVYKRPERKEEYLLVDGYNIIYAWNDLKALAETNIDGARGRLTDILSNYQAIRKCNLIVVFDAYRVPGGQTKVLNYHNIHVVYTKEAETADQYIEKFAHQNSKKYHVTVATSDGLEQIIIRGAGCALISARELKEEIELAGRRIQEEYSEQQGRGYKRYLFDDQRGDAKSDWNC